MTDEARNRADARLETALASADRRDPRPFYRRVLAYLKERDAEGFQRALRYYEDELVPAVAGQADPLEAWADYGAVLVESLGAGRRVELDGTGRARPVESVQGARGLVLYLPDDVAAPVLVLRYPRDAAPAQRAAYELLVEGRPAATAYD